MEEYVVRQTHDVAELDGRCSPAERDDVVSIHQKAPGCRCDSRVPRAFVSPRPVVRDARRDRRKPRNGQRCRGIRIYFVYERIQIVQEAGPYLEDLTFIHRVRLASQHDDAIEPSLYRRCDRLVGIIWR